MHQRHGNKSREVEGKARINMNLLSSRGGFSPNLQEPQSAFLLENAPPERTDPLSLGTSRPQRPPQGNTSQSPSDMLEYAVTLLLAVSTTLTFFILLLPSSFDPRKDEPLVDESDAQHGTRVRPRTSVQVVVLGDIGRSPRMQYHALSIAKHGGRVDLIGYQESDVHPEIAKSRRIHIVPISTPPSWLQTSSKALFPLIAPLKVLWQVWSLFYAMGYRTKPAKWMLVQNPPSIPTLVIAQFVCFFRHTKLVIDWHNLGYTILALKLGRTHPLVKVSYLYESICARGAAAHFSVTNAMARVLRQKFSIRAESLHDRPSETFQPLSLEKRNAFLESLPETAPFAEDIVNGQIRLLVSSTSWTADEDFSLLLDALVKYSDLKTRNPKLPKILAIITGKGPMREHYIAAIKNLKQQEKLTNATVLTSWLSVEDYAGLLGAADLGISLHTSSSGVDLPMKVVDMFGAGLPVVGWGGFEAWSELVKEDFNGKSFESSDQLRDILVSLFGSENSELPVLKEGALKECGNRWDDEWDDVAGKLFHLVD